MADPGYVYLLRDVDTRTAGVPSDYLKLGKSKNEPKRIFLPNPFSPKKHSQITEFMLKIGTPFFTVCRGPITGKLACHSSTLYHLYKMSTDPIQVQLLLN